MILRYCILYVADVPATLAFYEAAFGLSTGFLHESNDYAEMATGQTKLAFSSHALMDQLGKTVSTDPAAPPAFELALETHDVPAALTRALAADARLEQDVTQMPWGQTLAFVRTPDGTRVEICTPVAA
jgi:catechol 2,3-dioxygenase-like lactoylglutathione lyase family enzyme